MRQFISGMIICLLLISGTVFANTGLESDDSLAQAKAFLFTGVGKFHQDMVIGVNRFERALRDSNTNWDITKWTAESSISKNKVVNQLKSYVNTLRSGDTLFIFYLGHGYDIADQPPIDENGPGNDGRDEVLVLGHSTSDYLVDDQLYEIWNQFQAGVNIIFITNSCQNGTVHRLDPSEFITTTPEAAAMSAGLIHIASSSDHENTAVKDDFSNNLAATLDNSGQYQGSYYDWYQEMRRLISYSTPQFQELGSNSAAIKNTQAFNAVSGNSPIKDSCKGNCGGQAPSGCWCDNMCSQYGDCCKDKVQHCGY